MSLVFADTVGFVALWNRSDEWHLNAKEALARIHSERDILLTTTFVLLECGNAGIVDQVSFVVMRRLNITKAFTHDRHFKAAGFEPLF